MNEGRKNLYSGIFIIVLSIVFYLATLGMDTYAIVQIKPQFVPQIVAFCLFILGMILFATSIKRIKTDTESVKNVTARENVDCFRKKHTPILTLFSIFMLILLLQYVGFIISAVLYLFAQINILSNEINKKSIFRTTIISIAGAIIIYVIFYYGLGLLLPKGIWFERI